MSSTEISSHEAVFAGAFHAAGLAHASPSGFHSFNVK
jgi:hypothetical protein